MREEEDHTEEVTRMEENGQILTDWQHAYLHDEHHVLWVDVATSLDTAAQDCFTTQKPKMQRKPVVTDETIGKITERAQSKYSGILDSYAKNAMTTQNLTIMGKSSY